MYDAPGWLPEDMANNKNEQSEGQVSEVQRLDEDDAETPQAGEDSTAGYPDSESGDPDTRGSGPDAAPPENRRDNENARSGHRRPGQSVEDEGMP